MKNILIILVSIVCLFSCGKTNHHPINTVEEVKVYDNDVISITSKGRHYDYQKVTIETHDFLFRTWNTKYGSGSNLVHSPNCKLCKKY